MQTSSSGMRWYDPSRCSFRHVASALLSEHRVGPQNRKRRTKHKRDESPWLAESPLGNYIRAISNVGSKSAPQLISTHDTRLASSPRVECLPMLPAKVPPRVECLALPMLPAKVPPRVECLALPLLPAKVPPREICIIGQPDQVWKTERVVPSSPSSDDILRQAQHARSLIWEAERIRVSEMKALLDQTSPSKSVRRQKSMSPAENHARAMSIRLIKEEAARLNSAEFDVVNELSPRTALRLEILKRFDSMNDMWNHFDCNASNRISMTEFQSGLDSLRINWAAITGYISIVALFKCFDANHNGELGPKEICGDEFGRKLDEYMSTMEMWTQWSDSVAQNKNADRTRLEKCTKLDVTDILRREELLKSQNEQKQKMKYLFSKGLRRMVSQKLLEKQNPASRYAEVESVASSAKNIQHVLYDMGNLRRDLYSTRKEMETMVKTAHEIQQENKRMKIEHKMAVLRNFSNGEISNVQDRFAKAHNSLPLLEELVTMFDMNAMGFSNTAIQAANWCRKIAKKYRLGIQYVERLKSEFDSWDVDESGFLDRNEFGQMLHGLFDVQNGPKLSDTNISQFWEQADIGNCGCVALEEFILFISGPGSVLVKKYHTVKRR